MMMMRKMVLGAILGISLFHTPAKSESAGGPYYKVADLRAYGQVKYDAIRFFAGEVARVVVTGDGDTDLDLYVYDSAGRLVAKDDDRTDDCVAVFVPTRTQYYTIVLVNRGPVFNHYVLATN